MLQGAQVKEWLVVCMGGWGRCSSAPLSRERAPWLGTKLEVPAPSRRVLGVLPSRGVALQIGRPPLGDHLPAIITSSAITTRQAMLGGARGVGVGAGTGT